jgi:DNA-binding transcriptional ArsR family regulator
MINKGTTVKTKFDSLKGLGIDMRGHMSYYLYKELLIYEVINMAVADEQARLLQCIGEPIRLQILKLLTHGEKYVGEIIDTLKKDQSLISYHLRHLRECNIVVTRQEAQRVYYRLSDVRLAELVNISEAAVKDIFVCLPQGGSNGERAKHSESAKSAERSHRN